MSSPLVLGQQDNKWQVSPGPGTRSDLSPVILGLGSHPLFWQDVYILQ